MFIVVLFTIAKTWNDPRCLSKEEWNYHKYTQWYSTELLKNEIMKFARKGLELAITMLSTVTSKKRSGIGDCYVKHGDPA